MTVLNKPLPDISGFRPCTIMLRNARGESAFLEKMTAKNADKQDQAKGVIGPEQP